MGCGGGGGSVGVIVVVDVGNVVMVEGCVLVCGVW